MILGAYRPRALSEGNPHYKLARTISDIMLVWETTEGRIITMVVVDLGASHLNSLNLNVVS